MKAHYLVSTLLFIFVVYATNIDVSIKKMFSENISIEYNDSENAENDTAEKGEKEDVEDEYKEFASSQHKLTQTLFQSKLNVIAALLKLVHPTVPVESPPPKV
ncbi:MAG: hypothetical protein FJ349_02820 [Sphingomonadales bacterium]|nr:hypothetical protein [Sphingomonadales bacterium]